MLGYKILNRSETLPHASHPVTVVTPLRCFIQIYLGKRRKINQEINCKERVEQNLMFSSGDSCRCWYTHS